MLEVGIVTDIAGMMILARARTDQARRFRAPTGRKNE